MTGEGRGRKLLAVAVGVFLAGGLHAAAPAGPHSWHWLHLLAQKLYYVPILMAASWFGMRVTLGTTLAVSLFSMAHVLEDWTGLPMVQAEQRAGHEARGTSAGRKQELFSDLVASNPVRRRRGLALPVSLAAHAAGIALLVAAPIVWPVPPPEHPDYVRVLLYDPPPPPPPPPPKGSAWVQESGPRKPARREPRRRTAALIPPGEVPKVQAPRPVEDANGRGADDEPAGSPTGSEFGTPEGMEGGVEGGVVGGIPDGVLGGIVGGTGDIPVRDPDRPPRLIKQTKPVYPQEAFVKKIEGTVLVELLIDATGRVARARVIRSVPLLDAAALEAVRQWIFSPAIKHGQPVATEALAPVTFRLY